jgi:hypothetical protein
MFSGKHLILHYFKWSYFESPMVLLMVSTNPLWCYKFSESSFISSQFLKKNKNNQNIDFYTVFITGCVEWFLFINVDFWLLH